MVFEDGLQQRDFVHVRDVATACRLALERPVEGRALNIDSGRQISVREVARRIGEAIGRPHIVPETTRQFRRGDIRHCFADISRAKEVLGFAPAQRLESDLDELIGWLDGQPAEDRVGQATAELERRGLVA